MPKNPRPATHVWELIKKYNKPLPPVPAPPRPGVIPSESLWTRFRSRKKDR